MVQESGHQNRRSARTVLCTIAGLLILICVSSVTQLSAEKRSHAPDKDSEVSKLSLLRVTDDEYRDAKSAANKELKSDDIETQLQGIRRLAKTDHPKAVKELFDVFKKKGVDLRVRRAAADALGKFSDPEALDEVISMAGKKQVAEIKKSTDLYYTYSIYRGLADSESEKARAFIKKILYEGCREKSGPWWATLAALEAVADSYRTEYHSTLSDLVYMAKEREEWHGELQIILLSAIKALENCTNPKKLDPMLHTLGLLIDNIATHTDKSHGRIRYLSAKAIYDLVNFKKVADLDVPTDTLPFLRQYHEDLRTGKLKLGMSMKERPKEGNTRSEKLKIHGVEIPGRKVVFVIDNSQSMEEDAPTPEDIKKKSKNKDGEVTGGEKEKEDKEEELPWDDIETKLDLAKAVLKRLLNNVDETYSINIVVYSTESLLLDEDCEKLVKATEKIKKDFKAKIDELEVVNRTNIHGALLDAMQLTTDGKLGDDEDLGLSQKALTRGADSIYFLTDGWSNWCDKSNETPEVKHQDKRWPDKSHLDVGEGDFVYGDQILEDFIRMNRFRKVVVNTVGVGHHDMKLMAHLAEESGGTYLNFSDRRLKNDDKPKEKKRKDDSDEPEKEEKPADGDKAKGNSEEKKADEAKG